MEKVSGLMPDDVKKSVRQFTSQVPFVEKAYGLLALFERLARLVTGVIFLRGGHCCILTDWFVVG